MRLFICQIIVSIIDTKILSVGIKYSVRNLLFDVNNCAWPTN